jgi:hypothetical protein
MVWKDPNLRLTFIELMKFLWPKMAILDLYIVEIDYPARFRSLQKNQEFSTVSNHLEFEKKTFGKRSRRFFLDGLKPSRTNGSLIRVMNGLSQIVQN